jgi:hypothetical protein
MLSAICNMCLDEKATEFSAFMKSSVENYHKYCEEQKQKKAKQRKEQYKKHLIRVCAYQYKYKYAELGPIIQQLNKALKQTKEKS